MQLGGLAARLLICGLPFLSPSALPTQPTPALLIDADSGQVLYAENAGQPWYPASVSKLMTAYVAFTAIRDGRVTLDTRVAISRHARRQPPAKSWLHVGDSVSLRDALYLMIVKSANDMAVAIAETVGGDEQTFVGQMNATAERMQLQATHYDNANGLESPGQVSSARDLAVLALNVRRDFPQYAEIFRTQWVEFAGDRLETSNNLLEHFPDATGMKTGFICQSGLNIVATVERDGRSLMAVVLGASSERERNELTAQLFSRALSGDLAPTAKVVDGIEDMKAAPVDMEPLICGQRSGVYIAARARDFPVGRPGQPSYLTDGVTGPTYAVSGLDLQSGRNPS